MSDPLPPLLSKPYARNPRESYTFKTQRYTLSTTSTRYRLTHKATCRLLEKPPTCLARREAPSALRPRQHRLRDPSLRMKRCPMHLSSQSLERLCVSSCPTRILATERNLKCSYFRSNSTHTLTMTSFPPTKAMACGQHLT